LQFETQEAELLPAKDIRRNRFSGKYRWFWSAAAAASVIIACLILFSPRQQASGQQYGKHQSGLQIENTIARWHTGMVECRQQIKSTRFYGRLTRSAASGEPIFMW